MLIAPKKNTYKNTVKINPKFKNIYDGPGSMFALKELASSVQNQLKEINDKELLEINLIDSNPANNPQPPKINQHLCQLL